MTNQDSPLKGFRPIGSRQPKNAPVPGIGTPVPGTPGPGSGSPLPPPAGPGTPTPSVSQPALVLKCAKCSFIMAPHMEFCPSCGTPAPHAFCPNCGGPNDAKSLFCESCGHTLPPPAG